MKNSVKQAVEKLSKSQSRQFIPLSHSNALNRYGSFVGQYDPYTLPGIDEIEKEALESKLLFGGMEILSVKHFDSSEWAEDESLDTVYSEKYDDYFAEAESYLTERFGTYQLSFNTFDYTSPFRELDKFVSGDHTKIKTWKPYGMTGDYYYLVQSMSAGDGDLLFILWIAHITPPNYEPPSKQKLP
jgi:hypothetical protein